MNLKMLPYFDLFQTLIRATKLRRAHRLANSSSHLQRAQVATYPASTEVAADVTHVEWHLNLIMARLDRIEAKIDLLPNRQS